ncbi:hypothetical protein DIPPA_03176 [Diplonema papillatum]|nr:hypothetical protein DIPPA_03176 [Diplonema papillatum]
MRPGGTPVPATCHFDQRTRREGRGRSRTYFPIPNRCSIQTLSLSLSTFSQTFEPWVLGLRLRAWVSPTSAGRAVEGGGGSAMHKGAQVECTPLPPVLLDTRAGVISASQAKVVAWDAAEAEERAKRCLVTVTRSLLILSKACTDTARDDCVDDASNANAVEMIRGMEAACEALKRIVSSDPAAL